MSWSSDMTNPIDVYRSRHHYRRNPQGINTHHASTNREKRESVLHYLDGYEHGVWVDKDESSVRTCYYEHGNLHNPHGLAFINKPNHMQDAYYIHGTKVEPTKAIDAAVNATDTASLARMVRYKNPAVAFFAAHNPYCPETAKTEHALTRGGDYPCP